MGWTMGVCLDSCQDLESVQDFLLSIVLGSEHTVTSPCSPHAYISPEDAPDQLRLNFNTWNVLEMFDSHAADAQ